MFLAKNGMEWKRSFNKNLFPNPRYTGSNSCSDTTCRKLKLEPQFGGFMWNLVEIDLPLLIYFQ